MTYVNFTSALPPRYPTNPDTFAQAAQGICQHAPKGVTRGVPLDSQNTSALRPVSNNFETMRTPSENACRVSAFRVSSAHRVLGSEGAITLGRGRRQLRGQVVSGALRCIQLVGEAPDRLQCVRQLSARSGQLPLEPGALLAGQGCCLSGLQPQCTGRRRSGCCDQGK